MVLKNYFQNNERLTKNLIIITNKLFKTISHKMNYLKKSYFSFCKNKHELTFVFSNISRN